jgi:hypothetical protein
MREEPVFAFAATDLRVNISGGFSDGEACEVRRVSVPGIIPPTRQSVQADDNGPDDTT